MSIFLDTNAFLHIAREIDATQKAWNQAPEYTPDQLSDIHLLLTTMDCEDPKCDFCEEEGLTYRDPETKCIYCLRCLEASTEPMDGSGEVDEEIVAIGQRILAEQAAKRANE